MRIRGRPRKAAINSVVRLHAPRHGVVVDYRSDVRSERYRIVESDARGQHPRGAAIWYDSVEFTPVGKTSKPPGRIYRKNVSPEERGCACQCCPHLNGYEEER